MKLTNYIASRYIGVATIVVLVSVPLFYIVLQRIIWNNVDEDLKFQRQWLEEKLHNTSPENFVSFNNNIIIRPGQFPQQERFYNEKLYIAYDNEMVPYRVLEFNNVTNGKTYAIRIQKSLMESEDVLRAIAAMQIGVLLILLLFLIFINTRLRRTVWKPFYKTLDALNRYRIDRDEPLNLSDSNIQEIENLNRSVNELIKHNREIFTKQKEFTENASHELQTPLAIIQSDLDLLWQTSALDEEQMHIVQNLSETIIRMSKLNKALLLLTKIDNRQFTAQKEIKLHVLIKKILDQYEDGFKQKNIRLQLNMDSSPVIYADEMSMEILFGNLISNAYRYTPENGNVEISLLSTTLIITNSAINNQPLEKNKLFQRFQKQQQSSQNSIGVGLEICKHICFQNNFNIQYYFSEGRHSFEVTFQDCN
ncbi:MAG TPA: HAMP domain-containing sensor histidine kinase [Dysgonamonadaceae bacterium]|jgi:signal transduction histidine kinase|nr:HAMP domain-containing sensor histidine kinase [Dysgonamonadaceae bacterium]